MIRTLEESGRRSDLFIVSRDSNGRWYVDPSTILSETREVSRSASGTGYMVVRIWKRPRSAFRVVSETMQRIERAK